MRKTIATLTTLAALAFAPVAHGAFGDDFGIAPINDGAGPLDDAPAIPGSHSFWAGACDRTAAPPPPPGAGDAPAPIPDGVGGIPSRILVPAELFGFGDPVLVPTPPVPEHCIDPGTPALYGVDPGLWRPSPDNNAITGSQPAPLGTYAPAWRLPAATQGGGHPDGSTRFSFARNAVKKVDGAVDNIHVDLPPGFVANPQAVPQCSGEQFAAYPLECPSESQVGVLRLEIEGIGFNATNWSSTDETAYAVYNLEPRQGNVAELGFGYASGERIVTVRLVGKVRTAGDYGVGAFAAQIPSALPAVSQSITLWGTPWAASNDLWRPKLGHPGNGDTGCNATAGIPAPLGSETQYIPPTGLTVLCQAKYEPNWGPIQPFLSSETDCNPNPVVTLRTDSFQDPGAFDANGEPDPTDPDWKTYESASPPVTGCEKVPFTPNITLDPVKQGGAAQGEADSPTGLDVELTIPQNNDAPFNPPVDGAPQIDVDQYVADAGAFWKSEQGLATAHLRDTTVALPEGVTLNPAAADGQGACSMGEIGVTDINSPVPPRIRFNNAPVSCPDSSKVAEVVVETPLLDEADWPTGEVYLAKQGDNPFDSDFAIYIALRSPDRDLLVKLAGKVTPDPATGRLTTTFTDNPELPFDTFRLQFKAGPRAALATPVICGTHTNQNLLASHAQPASPVVVNDPFQIGSSPAGGCAATKEQRPFGLGFSAGSTQIVGGAHSPFTVRIQRGDGNQEIDRVEVTTPEGLVAKLAGVPTCPDSAIAQAISRTATGDGAKERANPSCPAASQVGTTTIGAGAGSQPFYVPGKVYLAGPYKGAPLSLAFIVPAVAGPFDLGVQVVRAAVNVNPKTAQITTVSDPIPQILRGVPLRLRDIRVDIDRSDFTLNPTDCAEQLVTGRISGSHGAMTGVSNRFQVAECARMAFKPKLTLKLLGGTKRADYQGLTATLQARPGDANIASASVAMPRSAFLAQEHIRTVCTRVQFAADQCPPGSIYGKASAVTPLLEQPLSGPVYLRSSDNKLPDLVVALRGPDHQPIEVELSGRTDSVKGALRNTFDIVPDAAVSKFTLQLFGGKKGLIVNSQDLCQKIHRATVKMTAQNGRVHNFRPAVRNGCGKARKKGKGKRGRGGS